MKEMYRGGWQRWVGADSRTKPNKVKIGGAGVGALEWGRGEVRRNCIKGKRYQGSKQCRNHATLKVTEGSLGARLGVPRRGVGEGAGD